MVSIRYAHTNRKPHKARACHIETLCLVGNLHGFVNKVSLVFVITQIYIHSLNRSIYMLYSQVQADELMTIYVWANFEIILE